MINKLFYPTIGVKLMKLRLLILTKVNLILWSIYTRIPSRYGMYIAQYQCRFSEPLHYHHDGCPACYNEQVPDEDEFSRWYDENENQIDMWFYESGSYKDIGYEEFCLWLYDKVSGCRISDGGYWAPADGKPV